MNNEAKKVFDEWWSKMFYSDAPTFDGPSEATLRAVAEEAYFGALERGLTVESALEAQIQTVSDYVSDYHKRR